MSDTRLEKLKKHAEVIEGCRERRPHSQERLYKMFYGYAMAVALRYCTNREDAVEVVNDSFIKVFDKIDQFVISKPFKPWLRKIVVHTAIDNIRSNKKFQHTVEMEHVQAAAPIDHEADLNAQQIYKLLNHLPDLHRLVFNMYEIEGYSHREVSEQLEIAESSSRTYLARAKNRLRTLYKTFFTLEES